MFDFNLQEVSSKLDLDYELNRAVEDKLKKQPRMFIPLSYYEQRNL